MKLIIAVIQPDKLADVKDALTAAKVTKMTASNVIGCGQQMGYTETYRGIPAEVNLLKKVELRIAVNEDFLKPTIDLLPRRIWFTTSCITSGWRSGFL